MLWTLLLLAILLSGCSETSGPPPPETFSLEIEVVDPAGDPVPGLLVSAQGHVPEAYLPDGPGTCDDPITTRVASQPVTTFRMTVPDTAQVQVLIRDWSEEPVRDLVDGILIMGFYTLVWNGQDDSAADVPSGAYRVEMRATDLEGAMLFTQELVCYLWAGVDALVDTLGTTSDEGKVQTTDIQRFPGLLDIGPIPATNPICQSLGAFEVSTSTDVYLLDPVQKLGLLLCGAMDLSAGSNTITLVWDPTLAVPVRSIGERIAVGAPVTAEPVRLESGPTFLWDFSVCPNPFY